MLSSQLPTSVELSAAHPVSARSLEPAQASSQVPAASAEVKINIASARQAAITDRLFKKYDITSLQQFMGLVGFSCGVLSAYYELDMGSNFADKITAQAVKEVPGALLVLEGFFGLHAAIPTAALIGLPTRDYLIGKFDRSGHKKYVRPTRHPGLKKALDVVSDFISWSAATPFAYQLGIIVFDGNLPAQIIFAAASVMVAYPTSILGMNPLFMDRFNKRYNLESELIQGKRARLARKFQEILEKIRTADPAAIERLFQFYSQAHDQGDVDVAFFDTLKSSLGVGPELAPEVPAPPVTWGKWLLDGFGLGVGTAASYTLADLSFEAVSWFCDRVGLQEPMGRAALQYSWSITSTLPNCVFLSTFAQMRLNDIYYHYTQPNYRPYVETSRPELRRFLNRYSYVIGAFAAIPNVDLAIQEGSVASIPFAFLGMALAQSKAIEMLLQDITNYYDSKFAPGSGAFHRDTLIRIINLLLVEINFNLSPQEIIHFERAFFGEPVQHPQPEAKHDAPPRPPSPEQGRSAAAVSGSDLAPMKPAEQNVVSPQATDELGSVDLNDLPEMEKPQQTDDFSDELEEKGKQSLAAAGTAAGQTKDGVAPPVSPRAARGFFPPLNPQALAAKLTLVPPKEQCKIQVPAKMDRL